MTTSGSTNFEMNRDAIIGMALRKLRMVDPRLSVEAIHVTNGALALNVMIKAWQLDGVFLWLEQEVCLFQQYNTQRYSLGPSGDNCGVLTDCFKTQLASAAAASAGTITVDSDDDITNGDYIGIELDGGTIQWTTVNGAPSANVVTLTAVLTGAAAIDSYVFTYTTKISRPTKILEARVRDTSDVDTTLDVMYSNTEFIGETDKTSKGRVLQVNYTPATTNGLLRVWPICDTTDITDRIIMTIQRTVEDFDSSADTFDGPTDALAAMVYGLAVEYAPECGVDLSMGKGSTVLSQASRYYQLLKRTYGNREPVFMSPK